MLKGTFIVQYRGPRDLAKAMHKDHGLKSVFDRMNAGTGLRSNKVLFVSPSSEEGRIDEMCMDRSRPERWGLRDPRCSSSADDRIFEEDVGQWKDKSYDWRINQDHAAKLDQEEQDRRRAWVDQTRGREEDLADRIDDEFEKYIKERDALKREP